MGKREKRRARAWLASKNEKRPLPRARRRHTCAPCVHVHLSLPSRSSSTRGGFFDFAFAEQNVERRRVLVSPVCSL